MESLIGHWNLLVVQKYNHGLIIVFGMIWSDLFYICFVLFCSANRIFWLCSVVPLCGVPYFSCCHLSDDDFPTFASSLHLYKYGSFPLWYLFGTESLLKTICSLTALSCPYHFRTISVINHAFIWDSTWVSGHFTQGEHIKCFSRKIIPFDYY